MHTSRWIVIAFAACVFGASCGGGNPPRPQPTASPLSPLVDEYLEQFARRHPSIAAGNGLHMHDDTLEDLSAASIGAEVDWLRAFRGRLDALDPAALSADE